MNIIKWSVFSIFLAMILLFMEGQIQRYRLNEEDALGRAIILMSGACKTSSKRDCEIRGINIGDMSGPISGKINSKPNSKSFQFTWKHGDNELLVAVFDNDLFVESEYWWRWADDPRIGQHQAVNK